MLQNPRAPFKKIRKSVLFFGIINCILYLITLVLFKFFNLHNVSALCVLVNSVILCLLSFYQIKYWVKRTGIPLSFLESFGLVFFTGSFSFILFSILIISYSRFDTSLMQSIVDSNNIAALDYNTSAIVISSEGIGSSIVVAFIGMMYSDRYADHEIKP